jgi:hypothetical protein
LVHQISSSHVIKIGIETGMSAVCRHGLEAIVPNEPSHKK